MSSKQYLLSSKNVTTRQRNKENDRFLANKNTDTYAFPTSNVLKTNVTVDDSQNFMLRLSESLDDSFDEVLSNGASNNKTVKQGTKETTIWISDSSSSNSPDDTAWKKSYAGSSVHGSISKNIKSPASSYNLEISSDSDDNRDVFRKDKIALNRKCDDKFERLRQECYESPRQYNVYRTSDEGTNSTGGSNDKSNDGKTNSSGSTHVSPTPQLMSLTKRHTVSKINSKIVAVSQNVHDSFTNSLRRGTHISSDLRSKKHGAQPKSYQLAKTTSPTNKLTRKDTRNILETIKSTSRTYCSSKVQKDNKTTYDRCLEKSIRPPVRSENKSCPSEREIGRQNVAVIIDETNSDFEDEVIQTSRVNLLEPCKTHVSKFLQTPDQDQIYSSLSERKKQQISRWLLTNLSDSKSDSSCSNVCESNRNSLSSGNSSLDRLEMKYETPNNRGRLPKINSTDKITTIPNSDERDHSVKTRQTTLDALLNKARQNTPELQRSDRSTNKINSKRNNQRTYNEVSTSKVNTPAKDVDIVDYADILDKLYGNIWRSKADALLPTSEPRKQNVIRIDRGVQTEKKILPKSKNCARKVSYSDSDNDEFDAFIQDIRPQFNSTKKLREKNKKAKDTFIDDGSSNENSGESIYYTALTNPKESSTHRSIKPTPMSITTQRALAICDSETDDDSVKDVGNKNLNRKRLSFTEDENDSSTSEFDPGDAIQPKSATKKVTSKTSQVQKSIARLPVSKPNEDGKVKSFLASLSAMVPMANVHPEAKKYRLNYKKNKEELCKRLYKLYNDKIFDNKLPDDMTIEWNIRMRGTAGFCYNKKSTKALGNITRSSRIVLATKILDTADRLRDTLVHEMCHAAAWLINSVSDGHGPYWKGWACKAMKTFPELPPVKRCHDYKIMTKFTYRCTSCGYSIGRHSKSLDIEKKRCGHCYGKFELLINRTTRSGRVQLQTPNCSKELPGFARFVKENYHTIKNNRRSIKHSEVMKVLGQQFSAIKITKKHDNAMAESP